MEKFDDTIGLPKVGDDLYWLVELEQHYSDNFLVVMLMHKSEKPHHKLWGLFSAKRKDYVMSYRRISIEKLAEKAEAWGTTANFVVRDHIMEAADLIVAEVNNLHLQEKIEATVESFEGMYPPRKLAR